MTKLSAGILLYRGSPPALEVLLVHPGGPFWAKKDDGAWSIPKGEYDEGEDPLAAAIREFAEELGSLPPQGEFVELGETRTAEPEDHLGLRSARRLRSCELAIEPVRAGMAAEERAEAVLSRGRSRPVVHARRGARQDPAGPGALYRPVARAAPVAVTESCATFRARLPRAAGIGGCARRPGSSIFCHRRLNLWTGGESD